MAIKTDDIPTTTKMLKDLDEYVKRRTKQINENASLYKFMGELMVRLDNMGYEIKQANENFIYGRFSDAQKLLRDIATLEEHGFVFDYESLYIRKDSESIQITVGTGNEMHNRMYIVLYLKEDGKCRIEKIKRTVIKEVEVEDRIVIC